MVVASTTSVGSFVGAKLAEMSQPGPGLTIARTIWDADVTDDEPVVLFIDESHCWRNEKEVVSLLTLLEQQFIETRIDRFYFRQVTAILATTEKSRVGGMEILVSPIW